jgi:hypothetical protein
MKLVRSLGMLFAALALVAVSGPTRAIAQGSSPNAGAPQDRRVDPGDAAAGRATELTNAMEYDKARAELGKADPNSPSVALAKARLALYEEECDLAAVLTSRQEVAQGEEGRIIADVARGCARVTAATVVDRDDAAGVSSAGTTKAIGR